MRDQVLVRRSWERSPSQSLRFCRDSELEATAEIMAHVSNQDLLLNVEWIRGHPKVQEMSELLVKWQGLEEVEASWAPYVSLNVLGLL